MPVSHAVGSLLELKEEARVASERAEAVGREQGMLELRDEVEALRHQQE